MEETKMSWEEWRGVEHFLKWAKADKLTSITKEQKMKPILCLDFDGTLTTFAHGWQGPTIISDPPVEGCFEWLEEAVEHFDVHIYSHRSQFPAAIDAMRHWFFRYGLPVGVFDQLVFDVTKPPAHVTLDDRGITFNGKYPPIKDLLSFVPWNGQPT